MSDSPAYDDALALLHAWTQGESLRRHAYAVEAAVEAYAEHFEVEDMDLWRMTALLHDMDYERHPLPDEHPFVGVEELRRRGYPEEMTTAILGHATYSGVPRKTLLAKTLFACDELAGFVTACAYVRPNGIADLEPRSVLKKLKDKAFAAAVSRDDIRQGAEELGVDLPDHVARVIEGLRRRADRVFGSAA
jgi:putative nucleotidyltransferase with HDIG domain